MGLISLVCPKCGAKLSIDEDKDIYFCQYCGNKVIEEKQKIELSGTVNVAGMATDKTLLMKGSIQLNGEEFLEAMETFERVLDINPKCSEAYVGKLLAKLGYRDKKYLKAHNEPIDSYIEYENAITYGNEKEKKELSDISDSINNRLLCEIEIPKEPLAMPRSSESLWALGCILVGAIVGLIIGLLTKVEIFGIIFFVTITFYMIKKTRNTYLVRNLAYENYLKQKATYDEAISDEDAYRRKMFNQFYR